MSAGSRCFRVANCSHIKEDSEWDPCFFKLNSQRDMSTSEYVFPSLPRNLALTSSTFRIPPLDRSLPEIYDWHYEHTKNHTLFVYSDGEGNVTDIKWPRVIRAIHAAGRLVRSRVPQSAEGTPVIAILASSGKHSLMTDF
jgi:hypothetical protein